MHKHFRKFMSLSIAFLLIFSFFATTGPFITSISAATNSQGFTIINNAAELDTIVRKNLSGKYILNADIDLSEYAYTSSTWTAKKGWDGIGSSLASSFKGIFDGNGHVIKGLWSKDRGSNQGLFRWISGGTVRNLNIELSSEGITGSGERKGALAGNAYYGSLIENCHVFGAESPISGSANYIAGFVGVVYQSEINYSSVSNVSASGYSYTGGFIGVAHGASRISGCSAKVSVSGKGSYSGGFAGALYEGTYVECSQAFESVYAALSYSGGFAGALYGGKGSTLSKCYAFGDVRADLCYAGGLVGTVYDNSVIEQSCAYGDVSAKGYCVGGLAGEVNRATIKNSYAQGNVSGTTGTGGLVGYFSSAYGTSGPYNSIENSYSTGTVSGKGTTEQGAYSGMTAVKFYGTNYYDKTSTPGLRGYGSAGKPSNHGGNSLPQGKDTAPMMQQGTFVGWDFDTIWGIDENETTPYFVHSCDAGEVCPIIEDCDDLIDSDIEDDNTDLGYTSLDKENILKSISEFEINANISNGYSILFIGKTSCPACQVFIPKLNNIAKDLKYKEVLYLSSDATTATFKSNYDIKYVPTTILFKDGKEIDRVVGDLSEQKITEFLTNTVD